jgi:hypothetical protein
MTLRYLTICSVAGVIGFRLMSPAVAGQAPTATSKPATTEASKAPAKAGASTKAQPRPWSPPHTPWGDPDLQGIWNDATSTPLQRPDKYSGKDVLTDEEAAGFGEELAFGLNRDRRDGGAAVDVNRAYNEHWMDAKRLKATADKRTSLIIDPADGRIPPLVTPPPDLAKRRAARAEAARRFNDGLPHSVEDMSLPVRCIIRTDSPPYLPTIYNNDFQIFQSPGYVVIAPEMIHSARIIPVDGRPHIPPNLKQWLGDTRGHWEGNTLVIETSNLRQDDGVVFQNANPATFRIVERFERVNPGTIHYTFTISDPSTWTRPWTAMVPWNRTDEQMYEYQCHESNYDLVHLLSGARIREKQAAGQ